MQAQMNTLTSQMASQQLALNQELREARETIKQKNLQIDGFHEHVNSLMRRVAECESTINQHHPPGQPPSIPKAKGAAATPHTAPEGEKTPKKTEPAATVTAVTQVTQQLPTPNKLKAKVVKTQDMFIGNLEDNIEERDIIEAVKNAGTDICEEQLKLEEIPITTIGKAFKATVPQNKYLEICKIIESIDESIKVEAYRPRKSRSPAQGSQHQQRNNARNRPGNRGRGPNHQTFRSPSRE